MINIIYKYNIQNKMNITDLEIEQLSRIPKELRSLIFKNMKQIEIELLSKQPFTEAELDTFRQASIQYSIFDTNAISSVASIYRTEIRYDLTGGFHEYDSYVRRYSYNIISDKYDETLPSKAAFPQQDLEKIFQSGSTWLDTRAVYTMLKLRFSKIHSKLSSPGEVAKQYAINYLNNVIDIYQGDSISYLVPYLLSNLSLFGDDGIALDIYDAMFHKDPNKTKDEFMQQILELCTNAYHTLIKYITEYAENNNYLYKLNSLYNNVLWF